MRRYTARLSPENYATACGLAGDALLRPVPFGLTIVEITEGRRWAEFHTGVYIAADAGNVVRYVGSAMRAETGSIGDRIQEHVLANRAGAWTRLMVVPLRQGTERHLVRRIEGRIGLVLSPTDNARLPSLSLRQRPVRRR